MGESYLPDKDKMVPSDMKDKPPYLPPGVGDDEKKVVISSPPPPIVDLDQERRAKALEAATQPIWGPYTAPTPKLILQRAKLFEEYLRTGVLPE